MVTNFMALLLVVRISQTSFVTEVLGRGKGGREKVDSVVSEGCSCIAVSHSSNLLSNFSKAFACISSCRKQN